MWNYPCWNQSNVFSIGLGLIQETPDVIIGPGVNRIEVGVLREGSVGIIFQGIKYCKRYRHELHMHVIRQIDILTGWIADLCVTAGAIVKILKHQY